MEIAGVENEKKKVLIVEDESICQLVLRVYLKKYPIEARFCGDAEAGLACLDEFQPDLILMDLVLPRMDGIAAIEQIRHRAAFRRTPIIVTTTMNDSITSIEARESGANSYLVKPLRFSDVEQLLEKFLGVASAPSETDDQDGRFHESLGPAA